MKKFIISGLLNGFRVKVAIYAMSPSFAIKVFQQKYPKAKDIYVIQDIFKINS